MQTEYAVSFVMPDYILLRQPILLAEINTKLHSFLVYLVEIACIGQSIFTNFKTDMSIVD